MHARACVYVSPTWMVVVRRPAEERPSAQSREREEKLLPPRRCESGVGVCWTSVRVLNICLHVCDDDFRANAHAQADGRSAWRISHGASSSRIPMPRLLTQVRARVCVCVLCIHVCMCAYVISLSYRRRRSGRRCCVGGAVGCACGAALSPGR
jgi:hypothetical protein